MSLLCYYSAAELREEPTATRPRSWNARAFIDGAPLVIRVHLIGHSIRSRASKQTASIPSMSSRASRACESSWTAARCTSGRRRGGGDRARSRSTLQELAQETRKAAFMSSVRLETHHARSRGGVLSLSCAVGDPPPTCVACTRLRESVSGRWLGEDGGGRDVGGKARGSGRSVLIG